ncbi:MAG: hypothetical protein AB7O67_22355 [Vicinamibacterales bacterium]
MTGNLTRRLTLVLLAVLACAVAGPLAASAQTAPRQTQEDDYTRYELLEPGSAKFRILYEVTATTEGNRFFFNTIRPGSVATDESVVDVATGEELKFEVVDGEQARRDGHPAAEPGTDYIKVYLRTPVPKGGQVRLLILKTYEDAKSYFKDGDQIVFDRSLGIRRNSVVLPKGYRLVNLNVPSQVMPTEDGRVMVSFMNPGPGAAPLVIRAEPGLQPFTPDLPSAPAAAARGGAMSQARRLAERAHDQREAVYDLGDPAGHTFVVREDSTEDRLGASQNFDVVPDGATVGKVEAVNLDTGEPVKVDIWNGAELERRGLVPGEPVAADTKVVVISFVPAPRNGSTRLRVTRTMTDAGRYRLDDGVLVWDAGIRAPRAALLLPAGWSVTASSVPVTISRAADGRQRLYYENLRPGALDLLVRARK